MTGTPPSPTKGGKGPSDAGQKRSSSGSPRRTLSPTTTVGSPNSTSSPRKAGSLRGAEATPPAASGDGGGGAAVVEDSLLKRFMPELHIHIPDLNALVPEFLRSASSDPAADPEREEQPPSNNLRSSMIDGTQTQFKNIMAESNRLKGYMALLLFSIISYNEAYVSDRVNADRDADTRPLPPSASQRSYAMSVALVTMVLTGAVVLVHFDRITCLKRLWRRMFKRGSKTELFLLIFLVLWWSIATWVNTNVRGIAGEGSGQYNLYYCTWVCCITTYWLVERWRTAAGKTSTQKFLQDMPARSSSWAIAFACNALCFAFAMDLWNNVIIASERSPILESLYVNDPPRMYQWLLLVCVAAASFSFGVIFVVLELFRERNVKSDRENMFEGALLLVLVIVWVPTATIVTAPGGVAHVIGNTYFATWASTVTVIQTFAHWIMDWRDQIHKMIEVQLIEYEMAKRTVLEESEQSGQTEDNLHDEEKGKAVNLSERSRMYR